MSGFDRRQWQGRPRCLLLLGIYSQMSACEGPLPASTPTRPIATMHTAKTKIVCQPQWNSCLLRPKAYYRHDGSAAWIDPIILGTITISWNEIRVPVGCRIYRRDDENPSWFVMEFCLPMGCSNECSRATQRQGCCESKRYGHCPHVSTSLPTTTCDFVRLRSFLQLYHICNLC
jgi:hypothetical protein